MIGLRLIAALISMTSLASTALIAPPMVACLGSPFLSQEVWAARCMTSALEADPTAFVRAVLPVAPLVGAGFLCGAMALGMRRVRRVVVVTLAGAIGALVGMAVWTQATALAIVSFPSRLVLVYVCAVLMAATVLWGDVNRERLSESR